MYNVYVLSFDPSECFSKGSEKYPCLSEMYEEKRKNFAYVHIVHLVQCFLPYFLKSFLSFFIPI